jgi:hypothetical protein
MTRGWLLAAALLLPSFAAHAAGPETIAMPVGPSVPDALPTVITPSREVATLPDVPGMSAGQASAAAAANGGSSAVLVGGVWGFYDRTHRFHPLPPRAASTARASAASAPAPVRRASFAAHAGSGGGGRR